MASIGRRVRVVTSDYSRGTFRSGIPEEHRDQPKGQVPPVHALDSTSSALAQSPRVLMPKIPGLRLRKFCATWGTAGIDQVLRVMVLLVFV